MAERAFASDLNFGGHEKRESPRFVLLLRPAKVVTSAGEYLCILRDVASKGVRLKLFHALPHERHVVIELANGDRYEVEKVWERDGQAGFTFRHPTGLEQLLEERSRFAKRQLRLRTDLGGIVVINGIATPIRVSSLSQSGGAIDCAVPLALDQRFQLELPGLASLVAKVRWRRAPSYGLAFEQTFKLDELARLVSLLQPAPPPLGDEDELFGPQGARWAARD